MKSIAIASYRPKPDKEEEFMRLLEEHVPLLRREGFVTDREPFLCRAEDGTLIEVFEWISEEAKAEAHQNPAVEALWDTFYLLADMVPLCSLPEAKNPFANFSEVSI